MLDAQRPYLDTLDTWEAWEGWRDAVVAHYGSQPHWGCPIGALVERADRQRPRAGRRGHRAHGPLAGLPRGRAEAHARRGPHRGRTPIPRALALSTFAALHGGLLLTQTMQSTEPLEAALDGALAALRGAAPEQHAQRSDAIAR